MPSKKHILQKLAELRKQFTDLEEGVINKYGQDGSIGNDERAVPNLFNSSDILKKEKTYLKEAMNKYMDEWIESRWTYFLYSPKNEELVKNGLYNLKKKVIYFLEKEGC